MSYLFLITQSVQDMTGLTAYLQSVLEPSVFKYVSYIPSRTTVIISATLTDIYTTYAAMKAHIQDLMNEYVDSPAAPVTSGLQTAGALGTDMLISYTSGSAIKVLSNVSMEFNRITNIANPSVGRDVANKQYVDQITGGIGLTKASSGAINVNLNGSLEVDTSNRLRISSGALGTGLTGGSGSVISVSAIQPQITLVGTLSSLTVSGSMNALLGINVNNNRILNVATPILATDCCNKDYVDRTVSTAGSAISVDDFSIKSTNGVIGVSSTYFGSGLVGGSAGVPVSVAASQPGITSVGTLISFSVSGISTFTNTADSTSATSGALQLSGGIGIAKSAFLGGSLFVSNGINANNKTIGNVGSPVNLLDVANKSYVDSSISTPGGALSKSGTVLSVIVDNQSIEISPLNQLRIASGALGTGLSGGSGNVISVAATQPQITLVGTLSSLTVSGTTVFTASADATAANTGSVQLFGGASIIKGLYVGGASMLSSLTVSSTATFGAGVAVTSSTDASVLGQGSLVLSGGLSVAKGVQLGGILSMNSQRITNLATPTSANDAVTKAYSDSLVVTAGSGLTKTGSLMSVSVDGSSIEIVNGLLRISSSSLGTGLSGGSGVPISVNSSQPGITSLGTLTSLTVSGAITANGGINSNNVRITNVGYPTSANDAASKTYVDTNRRTAGIGLVDGTGTAINVSFDTSLEVSSTNALRISSAALGTGLLGGSGTVISVNPLQSGITTVGILSSLTVSGTVAFNNTTDSATSTTGAAVIAGGLGVAKNAYIAGNVNCLKGLLVTGVSSHAGQSSFSAPVTILDTTDSVGNGSGSVVISGGIGIGKTLSVGSGLRLGTDSLQQILPNTRGTTREYNFVVADGTNMGGVVNMWNSVTGSAYTSTIRLFNSSLMGSTDNEYLEITASSTGATFNTKASGAGLLRNLTVNNVLQIANGGPVTISGTTASTSVTTGALMIPNGGVAIGGALNVSGVVSSMGGFNANNTNVTNVANPTDNMHAANKLYVDTTAKGILVKSSVVAATTAPVTLTAVTVGSTIDTQVLNAGDRVLIKDQTDLIQNGVYVVQTSGGVLRASDMAVGSNAQGFYVFIQGGDVNLYSGWIVVGTSVTVGTSQITWTQFSGSVNLSAGAGLVQSGNTMSAQTDNFSLEIVNDQIRLSSVGLGQGLTGGSSVALAVNPNLSFLTGVGTLITGTWNARTITVGYGGTGLTNIPIGNVLYGQGTGALGNSALFFYNNNILTVPSLVSTSTTATASVSTGAIVTSGGMGIGGDIRVGGVGVFAGTITMAEPTLSTHGATKNYVDSNLTTAGTGLTKTGTVLSVNASQRQITAVGTLQGMTSSGPVSIIDTTSSTSTGTGSLVTNGGVGIGENLNVYGNMSVRGATTFTGTVVVPTPVTSSQAAPKSYVDSSVSTAGTGLVKTGTVMSVAAAQPTVTSVGTLTNLSVAGPVLVSATDVSTSTVTGALQIAGGVGIGGSIYVGLDAYLLGNTYVSTPSLGTQAANKSYVDSQIATPGTGLSRTGTVMSVNANQSQVTTVGTLTSLSVSGDCRFLSTTTSTSYNSGSVTVAGGMGISGDVFIAGNTTANTFQASSNGSFGGTLVVSSTIDSTSVSTGSLQTFGGAAIRKSLFCGGMGNFAGSIIVSDTTGSIGTTTGSIVTAGGIGATGSVNIGGTLTVTGFGTVRYPTQGTHIATKQYVDDTVGTAGTGLTKTGVTLSVNAAQPQIVSVGVLTGLSVSGQVLVTGTAQSTSFSTGCLVLSGGLGIAGNVSTAADVSVGGNLSVTGGTTFTGTVTAPLPTTGSQVATKSYVDSNLTLAGTGLTKTGNTLSVAASQTQITDVGSLNSLTVLGSSNFSGFTSSATSIVTATTASLSVSSGALVVLGGIGVSAASYLSDVNLTGFLSIQSNIDSTSTTTGSLRINGGAGISKNLYVGGKGVFSGAVTVPVTPSGGTDATSKAYVDGISYLTVGTGLVKTGGNLSLNSSQITSVGTLTGLAVSGIVSVSNTLNSTSVSTGALQISGGVGIGGSVYIGGSVNVSGASTFLGTVTVPPPLNPTDAVQKSYVDSATWLTAGVGLSKSGSTINVNPAQTQVTSVGTLISLNIAGKLAVADTSLSNSSTSGALTVAGGVGIGGSLYVGGNLNVTGTAVFTGTVTVGLPINSTDAANRGYVDSATNFVAGVGLIRNGMTWSVDTAQPEITSVGVLTSVTTSGTLIVSSTTASISPTSGAMQIAGGAGIGGSLYVGSGASFSGAVTLNTSAVNGTDAVNKNYVDGMTYITAGTGLSKSSGVLSVNPIQSQITSVGTLTGLVSAGNVSISATTAATSCTTGALIVSGGVGILGSLYTCQNLNIQGGSTFVGQVVMNATTVSSSAGTGALVIAGGLGLGGGVNTGGSISVGGGLTVTGSSTFSGVTGTIANFSGSATFSGGVTSSKPLLVTDTTPSTSIASGSVVISGGVGCSGAMYIGSSLNVSTGLTVTGTSSLGQVNIVNTTASSSTTTGALTVAGGIGIKGSIFGGTNLSITGTSTLTGKITTPGGIAVTNTAVSSSTITGAVTVSGGVGIAGSVNVGTNLGVTGTGTFVGTVSVTNTTVSSSSSTGAVVISGGIGVGGSLNVGGNLYVTGTSSFMGIVTVPNPVNATDAVTKSYTDSLSYIGVGTGLVKSAGVLSVSPIQTQITSLGNLGSLVVSGNSTFSGAAVFSSTVTVPNPVNPSDAVTKSYADALNQGLSIKTSVSTASAGVNYTLSSIAVGTVIDNVTLALNDRILLKDQTTQSENGIYVVGNTGPPARASDLAAGINGVGAFTFVQNGLQNSKSGWVVANVTGAAIVGTDPLVWTQFSSAGDIVGGDGLTKTGNTLTVNVDGTSIEISNDILRIGSRGLGTGLIGGSGTAISVAPSQPQITTIGTLASLAVSGAATFSNGVTIMNAPSVGTDAVNRSYVDGLSYLAAGSGLSLTGKTLSVNASQPGITSVGVLTGILSSGSVVVTNTVDAASATIGSINTAGGIAAQHTVWAGDSLTTDGTLDMNGSTSGTCSFQAAAVTTSYTMTMPPALPSTTSFLEVDSGGNASFIPVPFSQVYNGSNVVGGSKMYTVTVSTSGGVAVCYPTSNGTGTGTALFGTIFFAMATARNNTTNYTQMPWCSLNSIAADNKTVTFNIMTGTTVAYSGASTIAAPNGVTVQIMIVGI